MRAPAAVFAVLMLSSLAGFAQAPPAMDVHDALRKVRDDVIAAIDRGDVDAILVHLHPNVIFTPLNGRVCHGPAEVRAYFEAMMKGPHPVVKSLQVNMDVDRRTDLYGDTGIASGDSDNHYVLTDGMDLTFKTRWTASLVRENGRWLITSFHASGNVFDNPLLDQAKAMMRYAALGGLVIGGLIGLLIGAVMGRRRKA
jgi:ketosteroid isomerase-like protein